MWRVFISQSRNHPAVPTITSPSNAPITQPSLGDVEPRGDHLHGYFRRFSRRFAEGVRRRFELLKAERAVECGVGRSK